MTPAEHAAPIDDDYDLYVAFQKQVTLSMDGDSSEKIIPRTFEDALIYANRYTLADISGSATTEKIKTLVSSGLSGVLSLKPRKF